MTQVLTGTEADLDFSIMGMFVRADIVVQAVIALLALASFWSWTIIFEKILHIRRVNSQSSKFEDNFWSGKDLVSMYSRINGAQIQPKGMERIFHAGFKEFARATGVYDDWWLTGHRSAAFV